MTQQTDIKAPWTLHFDSDGTEDVAVISDSDGEDLVRSRPFWLPESGDPVPLTLAAMQLILLAPKLLVAAKKTLTALELILEVDDPTAYSRIEWEAEPMASLKAVIAQIEDVTGRVA